MFTDTDGQENTTQETPATENTAAPSTNPLHDLLKDIKNEKGEQKYKTPEAGLEALRHSQDTIARLKREQEETAAKLLAAQAQADRVAELERTLEELATKGVGEPTGRTNPDVDIQQLVNKAITERETAAVAQANQREVVNALLNQFGQDAQKVFKEKATELGVTSEDLEALSAKSPKAVLNMLGVSGQGAHKQPNFAPSQGAVNTAGFQTKAESYLRRADRKFELGSSNADTLEEIAKARALVDELDAMDIDINELSKPSVYFKYFNK